MNDFMQQAHAFNRFLNILIDSKSEVLERMDTVKQGIRDIELNGVLEIGDIKYFESIGIPTEYHGLRDEFQILVYLNQIIDGTSHDLNFLFAPFYQR